MGSTQRTAASRARAFTAVRRPLIRAATGAVVLLLVPSGCGPGAGPAVSLTSDDPAGRIPAMKRAARTKDPAAVPKLVALLESDDPAERLYSIEALRRITGQTFGYNYYDSEPNREAAVGRWKQWLSEQR